MRCYVATPTVDYPKEKAILYLPDIFGIDLPNHQVREDEDLREADSTLRADLLPAFGRRLREERIQGDRARNP